MRSRVTARVTSMIRQLIVNNVLHRPIRTIVSVIAVGVEVALVILIVGLTSGLLQETAKRIEGIGADIMLQPPSASVFLAFSGAPMPIKIARQIARTEIRAGGCPGPAAIQFLRRRGRHLRNRSASRFATFRADLFSSKATTCRARTTF